MKKTISATDKLASIGSGILPQKINQFPLKERQVEPVSLLRKRANTPEVEHEEVIKILRQRKRMTFTEE